MKKLINKKIQEIKSITNWDDVTYEDTGFIDLIVDGRFLIGFTKQFFETDIDDYISILQWERRSFNENINLCINAVKELDKYSDWEHKHCINIEKEHITLERFTAGKYRYIPMIGRSVLRGIELLIKEAKEIK